MNQPRVVLVTGASAGVGRATAVAFGNRGDRVGLLARETEGLYAAAKEVEAAGGQALAMPTDVARHSDVDAAASAVESAFGPIDVWVNDAMTTVFSPFNQIAPDEYVRATEVTYLGVVFGTMAALNRMLPRDRGTIVQVGSALAYRAIPLQAPYCGAKHAVRGFTDSVRTELLHDRSRVWITSVHLPAVNTPQFDLCKSRMPNKPQPVPPIYQPEVAAEAIVWASAERRREVWVGGTTVATILANRLAPGLLDWYLGRSGFRSQQRDEPDDPDRPFNLFDPVHGDFGAHGEFDRVAHARSLQAWATRHRRWLGLGAAAATVSGFLLGRAARSAQGRT
jgi:NADP-dependent 3-hydroxy acid dehydrogenase YdfG